MDGRKERECYKVKEKRWRERPRERMKETEREKDR